MTLITLADALRTPDAWWESGVRLGLAAVFAALIGWDRERAGKAAGLRTYVVVAVGAAAFTLVAMEMIEAIERDASQPSFDPIRIIAAVVGGVGFLGAGAVIQSGGRVQGLTTAAGLWVIAGVGMAVAAGYYAIAAMTTGLTFIAIVLASAIDEKIPGNALSDDESG